MVMYGIILVNKPRGWTSFDVCAKIRNLSQTKKVGHSGTLDPMATGVLPIFLGKATKSIDRFLNGDKGYIAEMTLGVRTDTLDATGTIMPNDKCQISNECLMPNDGAIKEVFKKYTGEIQQKPPMYSAKKINGERLYKLARKGIEVEREPRSVTIYKLDLIPNPNPKPNTYSFYVESSKGTYVRVLVSDIGDELGCGAHLSNLERTYSHPFHISQTVTMQAVIDLARIGKLDTVVLPVEDFLK